MSTESESEAIRQKMHRLRRRIDHDATRWSADAHRWLDWKYHVQQHPFLTVAAAVTVGYLLVPGRRKTPSVRLDPQSREELIKELGSREAAEIPPQPSLLSNAMNLATNLAIRAAITYAGQQVGKVIGKSAWLASFDHENAASQTARHNGDWQGLATSDQQVATEMQESPGTPFGVFRGDSSERLKSYGE